MATSGKVPPKPQLKPSVPQKQEPAPARVRPREEPLRRLRRAVRGRLLPRMQL